MHIRYRPRINFNSGALGITGRESIDYSTAYAKITPTLVQPIAPPPVISVPISPPPSFYEPSPGTLDIPADQWQTIGPQLVDDPATWLPAPFVYSKDQIMDMLARGASETYERTGETDSGLPIAAELEQKSRELDATKNYIVNAGGEIIPVEPKPAGGGFALLAVAVASFFLLGG